MIPTKRHDAPGGREGGDSGRQDKPRPGQGGQGQMPEVDPDKGDMGEEREGGDRDRDDLS